MDEAGRPSASVVIPTWNGERFIGETLASVFAQTFRDFEVVVVDDGSTDGTRAALDPWADRILYVRQPRAGQSAARNRGAATAGGRYLAFLDHDDCWEPTYLARTVPFMQEHPEVGLVATALRMLREDGRPTPHVSGKKSPGPRYTTVTLLEGDVGTIVNPVVRADVFREAGGYDASIRGPEDCDLWLRISFLTEMRHVPEPLLLYRSHPRNFSKNFLENAREWLRVLDKFEREHPEFAREHPDLVRRNRAKQLGRLGRELLARSPEDRGHVAEARRALVDAIRLDPRRARSYPYAAMSFVPGIGPLYAGFRRLELRVQQRLYRSRVRAWLSAR